MIKLIIKIILEDIENPFQIILNDNEKYSFNYGFGRELWGFHNLRFKVKLYTFDTEYIKMMNEFLTDFFPKLKNYDNIKEISFEFLNTKNNTNEIFSFKKGEFSNFNMTQVIDEKHQKAFTIAFNINPKNIQGDD